MNLEPAIGVWWVPCCHLDLQELTDQAEVDELLELIADDEFYGDLYPDQKTALEGIKEKWKRSEEYIGKECAEKNIAEVQLMIDGLGNTPKKGKKA